MYHLVGLVARWWIIAIFFVFSSTLAGPVQAQQSSQTHIFRPGNAGDVDRITRETAKQVDRRRREVARAVQKKKCPDGYEPKTRPDGTETCVITGYMGLTSEETVASWTSRLGIQGSSYVDWEHTSSGQTTAYGSSIAADITIMGASTASGFLVGLLYGQNFTELRFDSSSKSDLPATSLISGPLTIRDNKSKSSKASTIGGYWYYFCPEWYGGITVLGNSFELTPLLVKPGGPRQLEMESITIGGDFGFQIPIDENVSLEPLFGAAHSGLNYGSGKETFGFEDEDSDLLWAGMRFTRLDQFRNVSVSTALTVALYGTVQEREVRARTELEAAIDMGAGVSAGMMVGVRGGEDYLGLTGRLGLRLQTDWLGSPP